MSGHTGAALIGPNNGSQLVQKPFSRGVLAAKVREVLDAPAVVVAVG
jgi:hypothetical protein